MEQAPSAAFPGCSRVVVWVTYVAIWTPSGVGFLKPVTLGCRLNRPSELPFPSRPAAGVRYNSPAYCHPHPRPPAVGQKIDKDLQRFRKIVRGKVIKVHSPVSVG